MPYTFSFFIDNALVFRCDVKCGRCKAYTKARTRCRRNVCMGLPYCYNHMLSEMHLRIDDSTVRAAGKGLYAMHPHNDDNNLVIFEPDDIIAEYKGEVVDQAELDRRYGNYTAPYGICTRGNELCLDGACKRGVVNFANHAPERRANAQFIFENGKLYLVATKDIKNHKEIFVYYGRNYRLGERRARHTTGKSSRNRGRVYSL